MQRTVLLANQPNRAKRFAPCAKPSHSSGLAFAMAKATQFQQGGRGAPTTITSRAQPLAAGTVKRWRVCQPLL